MRIKVLDERCKPEQHGDWCDLKVYAFDKYCYAERFGRVLYGVALDTMTGLSAASMNHDGTFEYSKGDVFKVSLGVAMEIPPGYHAQVVPRSSTRRQYGVMLTNSIGIIDNSYCGDNDIWMAEFYAVQDGEMRVGDRVLQFRLVKNGDPIELEYVDNLGNADRGGFGSTGR